jgi:nucleoside-diphosphate-sugar epimerase
MNKDSNRKKIVIYGGTGFVGSKVAEVLSASQAKVVCVSRKGDKPSHLQNAEWADSIDWIKGDAGHPDSQQLSDCTTLISLVGSPPIPTLSDKAYQQQLYTNGITNSTVIKKAGIEGVSQVILLGAKIPSFLNKNWFAYAKGKKLGIEAAKKFSDLIFGILQKKLEETA